MFTFKQKINGRNSTFTVIPIEPKECLAHVWAEVDGNCYAGSITLYEDTPDAAYGLHFQLHSVESCSQINVMEPLTKKQGGQLERKILNLLDLIKSMEEIHETLA